MAFLQLDGVTIDVRDGSFRSSPDDLFDESRAADGTWTTTEIARKREWTFDTAPLAPSDANAFFGFFNGQGHTFIFDADKYSSKTLGSTAGGTHSISATQSKFGGSSLLVGSASTIVYAFGTSYSSTFTVSCWKWTSGSAFSHYARSSDAVQYKAGAVHTPTGSDGVTLWSTMTSGNLTLDGQDEGGVNTTNAFYDQLVVVPYVMNIEMVAGMASASTAFAGLPNVTAIIGDTSGQTISTTVRPRVMGESYVQCNIDGTFYPDARILSVRLKEV